MKLNKNRLSKLAGILNEGSDRDLDEEEDDSSSDALHVSDPADDEDESGDGGLSSGYTLGGYGQVTLEQMKHIHRAVLQEMRAMEEGKMWDYFRGMTEPRGPWKDATGIEHDDMIGYQPISADKAAYNLAVALADRIDKHVRGWDGPRHPGLADMEEDGFHRIDGSHWDAVLEAVGPATADQAEAVLNKWKEDRYIVTTQPDVLITKGYEGYGRVSGIWLRWYGYKEMKQARDEGKQSASIQYGTY